MEIDSRDHLLREKLLLCRRLKVIFSLSKLLSRCCLIYDQTRSLINLLRSPNNKLITINIIIIEREVRMVTKLLTTLLTVYDRSAVGKIARSSPSLYRFWTISSLRWDQNRFSRKVRKFERPVHVYGKYQSVFFSSGASPCTLNYPQRYPGESVEPIAESHSHAPRAISWITAAIKKLDQKSSPFIPCKFLVTQSLPGVRWDT